MNNIKKIIYLTIFIFSTILFSGCLTANYNININKNGGSIVSELTMAKSTFDSLIDMGLDTDEVTAEGGTISYYTEDDVEYVKLSDEKQYNSLEELKTGIASLGTETSEDMGEPSSDYFTNFSLVLANNKFTISGLFNTVEDASSLYTKCTLTLVFPGKIISHNVGTKSADNIVTINMLKAWEPNATKNFTIIAQSGPNLIPIVILGVAVAILVGLSIFTIIVVAVKGKQRAMIANQSLSSNVESIAPSIEEPEDFHVDANGKTYYLDGYGNPYYLDDNGNPYYLDEEGNPFYVDENGRPFYIDENGNPQYFE